MRSGKTESIQSPVRTSELRTGNLQDMDMWRFPLNAFLELLLVVLCILVPVFRKVFHESFFQRGIIRLL